MSSAVSGASIRKWPFIWSTSLLEDFAGIQCRNLDVLTPENKTGVLLRRSPGGMFFFPRGRLRGCIQLACCSLARARQRVLRERCAFVLLPSKYLVLTECQCRCLGVSNPLGLFGAAGRASKCSLAALPTMTFFTALEDLEEVLREDFAFLPLLPSWEARSLVGSGAKESTPTLPRLKALQPQRNWFAAACSPVESVGRVLITLCRQKRGPSSAQWPGYCAHSGRFQRTARIRKV